MNFNNPLYFILYIFGFFISVLPSFTLPPRKILLLWDQNIQALTPKKQTDRYLKVEYNCLQYHDTIIWHYKWGQYVLEKNVAFVIFHLWRQKWSFLKQESLQTTFMLWQNKAMWWNDNHLWYHNLILTSFAALFTSFLMSLIKKP